MKRLTEKHYGANDYYMTCSEECERDNCVECVALEQIVDRLGAYEDTGLTPEEINDLASVREISPEAEYAINKHADSIIERLDKLLAQTDDDDRLRELAEADKEGRVVVLPCKVGDKLYRVFDGNISEHEVQNMKYFARQGRLGIDMTPFFPDAGRFIGKTVFLTREEAEEALRRDKSGNC